jgi:hypothetical protein
MGCQYKPVIVMGFWPVQTGRYGMRMTWENTVRESHEVREVGSR